MRMYILINVLYIYKIISILIISSDIVFAIVIRGRIFFRMIRCYFSCEDIPDKITEEGEKKKRSKERNKDGLVDSSAKLISGTAAGL